MTKLNEKLIGFAKEGKPTKYLRAFLTMEGIEDKEATKLLAELGIGRITAGFTQVNTLALLENGITEDELYRTLLAENAVNEARWVGDRNKIRKVINAVFERLGSPVEEKPASESLKAEVKALGKSKTK